MGWHPSFQPRWELGAACRDHPTWWWFATDSDSVESVEAFSICNACAVRPECLAFVLDHPNLVGIWAGTTYEDRQGMRRRTREARRHPRLDGPDDARTGPASS